MKTKLLLSSILMLGMTTSAHAGESCTDAKDLVRVAKAFYAADEDRVDIIDPAVSMKFESVNGHPIPDQMLYRFEGEDIYLDINEDGLLEGMEELASVSKDGELCRVMDGKVPQATEEDTTSVNVAFVFPYRRTEGQFAVSELIEGAKDGSKIMKGVAPGGLGFAVPGLKAIVLKPSEAGAPIPAFSFTREGEAVEVPGTVYDGSLFIRLKDIKSAKADKLSIEGDYKLSAMFKFDPEDLAESEAKRLAQATED